MLRARWRELETELRTRLNGHEGGNPGYSQADVLTGHRASSRPYQTLQLSSGSRVRRRLAGGRLEASGARPEGGPAADSPLNRDMNEA
jgi:hypothetical protein